MVVLWHLEVTANQVWENASLEATPGVSMKIHSELQPFSYMVDINHMLRMEPGSGQLTYGYNSELKEMSGGLLIQDSVVKTPGGAADLDAFTSGRNLPLCDKEIAVTDHPSSPVPNTFFLSAMKDVPVVLTVTSIGAPKPYVSNADTPIGVEFYIPYDYTKSDQEGSIKPAELPYGAFHSMLNYPQGYGTPTVISDEVSYRLTTKNLELKYSVPDADNLLDATVTGFPDYKAVNGNKNLATNGSGFLIHGNNSIEVLVDGNNESATFKTLRYHNAYLAPLSSKKPTNANTNKKKFPKAPWEGDTSPDASSWADIPGDIEPSEPDKWKAMRFFQEFVVMVSGFPEFGALYFNVTVDTVPGSFRVFMSHETKITIDQLCKIKNSKSPFQQPNPATSIDTGWQSAQ
jgi:hypothetical protein